MITKICPQCNKEFNTFPCRIKEGEGKYCSKDCANETRKGKPSWNKGKTGEESHMFGKKRPDTTKRMMGNQYTKGKPWSEARIVAQELKTGMPYEKSVDEYTEDWPTIRLSIYKRDKWICGVCNEKCVPHNHPDTLHWICCHHTDYDKLNNDHKNLITLCLSCHARTNYDRREWREYFIKEVGDF